MTAYVVDTNVAQVANRAAPQAGPQCIQNCIDALARARAGLVVIDEGLRILHEYQSTIGLVGQPGPGHIFVKWVFDNQAVESRCEQVKLTESTLNSSDFQEFPSDVALAGFDRSDRKFAAVAAASVNDPEILNAVDSDWWIYSAPLARNGLRVTFLCPGQFDGIAQVK